MTSWDRIQRLDLELRLAQARIRDLEASLELAQRIAVHLEQEATHGA